MLGSTFISVRACCTKPLGYGSGLGATRAYKRATVPQVLGDPSLLFVYLSVCSHFLRLHVHPRDTTQPGTPSACLERETPEAEDSLTISFCSDMSHSIPNAPKEWRNNHASGNARVQYGDVINSNAFPDQITASLDSKVEQTCFSHLSTVSGNTKTGTSASSKIVQTRLAVGSQKSRPFKTGSPVETLKAWCC